MPLTIVQPRRSRFSKFNNLLKSSNALWVELLLTVDRYLDEIYGRIASLDAAVAKEETATVPVAAPAGGSGGTVPLPPNTWAPYVLFVPTAGAPIVPGQLVSYYGNTVEVASSSSLTARCNFVCVSVVAGGVYLASEYRGPVLVDAGRGTDPLGRLWLSKNGRVTDERGDIISQEGDWQNGNVQLQQIGARLGLSGPVPAGFVLAHFRADEPLATADGGG